MPKKPGQSVSVEEVLYLVNRPGNRPSCDGAAEWLDLAIDRVATVFKKVWLRGDTDVYLTHNFDLWDERVGFVFVRMPYIYQYVKRR